MDNLTIFGLFAVTAMLVTYALEKRSPWFIGVCWILLVGSAYGFLQGVVALRGDRSNLGNGCGATMAARRNFKVAHYLEWPSGCPVDDFLMLSAGPFPQLYFDAHGKKQRDFATGRFDAKIAFSRDGKAIYSISHAKCRCGICW